jgi:hypothetical protein
LHYTLVLLLLLLLLQGFVDETIFANDRRIAALYDYVRVYNWPSGRRLEDGKNLSSTTHCCALCFEHY